MHSFELFVLRALSLLIPLCAFLGSANHWGKKGSTCENGMHHLMPLFGIEHLEGKVTIDYYAVNLGR